MELKLGEMVKRLALPKRTPTAVDADGVARTFGLEFKPRTMKPDQNLIKFQGGALPSAVDNSAKEYRILDQGQEGSCTAHAWTAAREYVAKADGNAQDLSRQWLYNMERIQDHTPLSQDGGSQVATGAAVLTKYGEPKEADLPYGPQNLRTKPSPQSIQDAKAYQLTGAETPQQVNSLQDIKTAIAAGQTVPLGFQVYESFMHIGPDGQMPMPAAGEQVVGGHAVNAVGYDDNHLNKDGSKGAIKIQNSWGENWGDKGHFYMPYKYAQDSSLVSDLWTIPLKTNAA